MPLNLFVAFLYCNEPLKILKYPTRNLLPTGEIQKVRMVFCFDLLCFCLGKYQVSKVPRELERRPILGEGEDFQSQKYLKDWSSLVDISHHMRRCVTALCVWIHVWWPDSMKSNYSPGHLTHLCPHSFSTFACCCDAVISLIVRDQFTISFLRATSHWGISLLLPKHTSARAHTHTPTHARTHTHTRNFKTKNIPQIVIGQSFLLGLLIKLNSL